MIGNLLEWFARTARPVRITAMSPQAFRLTGFECVAGVEYAQSWSEAEHWAGLRIDPWL